MRRYASARNRRQTINLARRRGWQSQNDQQAAETVTTEARASNSVPETSDSERSLVPTFHVALAPLPPPRVGPRNFRKATSADRGIPMSRQL